MFNPISFLQGLLLVYASPCVRHVLLFCLLLCLALRKAVLCFVLVGFRAVLVLFIYFSFRELVERVLVLDFLLVSVGRYL